MEETTQSRSSDLPEADEIIKKHIYVSMGIGLIPVPFLDFVGITGVQLDMLRRLAKVYKIPFSKDMVKNLIGTLIGSAFPASVSTRMAISLAKTIPVVGYSLGAASMSVISGASTYAVGKIFNRHFAEGGTFLTFDPEKARDFYVEMYKEGEKKAAELEMRKQ